MDNKNPSPYLLILFFGLVVSIFVIKGNYSPHILGVIIFCFIFVPTLIEPNIGLIIIIVSMLFSPEVAVGETTRREISIRLEDILLLVVVLAWFLKTAVSKNLLDVFRTNMTKPYFLYIAACVLSTAFAAVFSSIDIEHSFFCILKYFEYFAIFLMVRDRLTNIRQAKAFVVIFILVALVVSVYSNVYIEKQMAAEQSVFRAGPPVEEGARGRGGEAGTLGGYMVFLMAITGGLLIYTRSTIVRISLIGSELLMFRGFLYTLSRASYMGFVLMLLTFVYFTKRGKGALIYILVIASMYMAVFMPKMVKDRIFTTVTVKEDINGKRIEWEESPRERLGMWGVVVFDRFPKSPVFGHGVGRYFIDGQFFTTLSEVGLVGLCLFIWVLFRLFKSAKEVLDTDVVNNDDFSLGLTTGFLAGYAGLLLQAIGTNTFIIIRIMEPFWFMAAIVLSLPALFKPQEDILVKQA